MNKAQQLHDLGQSLWLDNITRELLNDGGLRRYIGEFSITGLTSNPTIFDQAIGATAVYDDEIRAKGRSGQTTESLFLDLALEDLRRAADLFRPIFDATNGLDGWVSMEIRRCSLRILRAASMRRGRFIGRLIDPIYS
jgi:transaldolase